MIKYIAKRILLMIPTLFIISIIAFIIIELPPGNYLTTYILQLEQTGVAVTQDKIDNLRTFYGLDQPGYVRYAKWIWGIISRGDFGQSFLYMKPVGKLIWDRLALTMVVALSSLLFTWIVAFPIGIYSAVKQYSLGDYLATIFGFIGLSIPHFLSALILLVLVLKIFNQSVGGLFSPEYALAPWSWEKVLDLLKHLWIPTIILGMQGTATLIRVMRNNLLDELHKPYVVTARAKGVAEHTLLLRYPVRAALNPFVSTVGYVLPTLVSGSIVVAVVLSLPTTGPLLLSALTSQDMYLAGTFILLLSLMTVVGTLISDILLAWLDPRIRLTKGG